MMPHVKSMVRRLLLVMFSCALVWIALVKDARAQMVFAPSITNNYEKSTDDTGAFGNSDSRVTTIDFHLGYLLAPYGILVGGMYKLEADSYASGDLRGFALGPSVGWTKSAFSVIGSYFLMAERKRTISNQESVLSAGHGYQLDLAWTPQVASNFGLGPQMTYRSVKYTKSKIGSGSETSNSYETSVLIPAIALWFVF